MPKGPLKNKHDSPWSKLQTKKWKKKKRPSPKFLREQCVVANNVLSVGSSISLKPCQILCCWNWTNFFFTFGCPELKSSHPAMSRYIFFQPLLDEVWNTWMSPNYGPWKNDDFFVEESNISSNFQRSSLKILVQSACISIHHIRFYGYLHLIFSENYLHHLSSKVHRATFFTTDRPPTVLVSRISPPWRYPQCWCSAWRAGNATWVFTRLNSMQTRQNRVVHSAFSKMWGKRRQNLRIHDQHWRN